MDLPRTLLHALHDRASKTPDAPALWTRRHGYYLPRSWRDYEAKVKHLSLGLIEQGLRPGDTFALLGFNREEWVVGALAAMAAGAVPVGLYETASPEQLEYVLAHSGARFALVENAAALATVRALWPRLPKLSHVLVMDAPEEGGEDVRRYDAVVAEGAGQDEGPYWARVHGLSPKGLAMLVYTSGTTGAPKGVMLSHENLVWTAHRLALAAKLEPREILLSYLPLSHIAEMLGTVCAALLFGFQVYFAESTEQLARNLQEVRPTIFFGVPRIWEKLKARVEAAFAELPSRRAARLSWARRIATDVLTRQLAHERVPGALLAQYELARRLVFIPLKEKLGFDRTRIFISAAAPIGRDVLDFFLSLDVVIREIYGQTEGSGPTTVNSEEATRLGTLGRPMLGVALRIAEDGEILLKGGNVCLGYYRDPEGTSALLSDGWLRSGDLGELDAEGYLRLTGRKKEILVTSGGKKTAPAHLEGLLRAIAPLGCAVVIGDSRPFLTALLPLDPEKVPAFARAKGWPQDPQALATHPSFLQYLDERIENEVNRRLSRFETIKRFRVLPRDFSVEGGELTPTLKLRRGAVEEKYAEEITALYAAPRERASTA